MNHAYCTQFDHNYLPRAMLMLRSLRQWDTDSIVYMLALSDLSLLALRRLALPNVVVISIAELEQAYPELLDVKLNRSPIEYVFTLTPIWPLHIFRTTAVERLTYLDADLYFFSSPKPLLDSTAHASISITPHDFAPEFKEHIVYGRFNVGWISYRRCAETMRCLESYAANCIAWCFDRVEDNRFADQRYLDAWPDEYAGVEIIEHKGVNVGNWRTDKYNFTEQNGAFFVDNDPLICYHFTGISIDSKDNFEITISRGHLAAESVLARRIIRPYVAMLMLERYRLATRYPALVNAQSLRYQLPPTPHVGPPWNFAGKVWPPVPRRGRNSDAAVSAAISLFLNLQNTSGLAATPLLEQIIQKISSGRSQISVLDWYGGVGQNYLFANAGNSGVKLDWHIVEAPVYCDFGRTINNDVHFHENFPPAQSYDLVFVHGTLGLQSDWRATLSRLCGMAGQAVVLAPVFLHNAGSFVAVHYPPEWRDGQGVTSWIIGEKDLYAAVAEVGFTIVGQFPGAQLGPFPEVPGQSISGVFVLVPQR